MTGPDRTHALVACWMDDVIMSINLAKMTIDRKLRVGSGPRAFGQFLAP